MKTEEGQMRKLWLLCVKLKKCEMPNVWTVKIEEGQRPDFWVWRRKRTQLREVEEVMNFHFSGLFIV